MVAGKWADRFGDGWERAVLVRKGLGLGGG